MVVAKPGEIWGLAWRQRSRGDFRGPKVRCKMPPGSVMLCRASLRLSGFGWRPRS